MSSAARCIRLSQRQVELLAPPYADDSAVDELLASLVANAPRLTAEILAVKRVGAGAGVSYGHTYRTATATTLALIAIGYGHGVPRKAGNHAFVTWGDGAVRMPIVGRVAMDVLTVDAGDAPLTPGESVVFFGNRQAGELSLAEWCEAVGEHPFSVLACLDERVSRKVIRD